MSNFTIDLAYPLSEVYADEDRNTRGSWEYDTDPKPGYKPGDKGGLFEDVDQNGIHTPIWTSILDERRRKAYSKKAGRPITAIVIRGHRRCRIARQINATDPTRFTTIPTQIFTGLTEAEEVDLLVDPAKPMTEWGVYLAIKRLSMTKGPDGKPMSEDKIAAKLSRSRGFVQAKMRIAKAPKVVEAAYRAKAEGKPTVNLTEANLVQLNTARLADEKVGVYDGNGGPAFTKAWGAILETGVVTPSEPKALTRKELLSAVNIVKDPILTMVLRYAAGDDVTLAEAVEAVDTLRDHSVAWLAHLAGQSNS